MIDLFKQALTHQFEAALCMLNQCVGSCKPEHWEGKIANDTFRQMAYHTLFYADLYLSTSEEAFKPRHLIQKGGDERGPILSPGLPLDETLEYAAICRQKVVEIIPAETQASLEGPSGFPWIKFTRAELHLYNLRHIQHHTGQFSAYLRRVDPAQGELKARPFV